MTKLLFLLLAIFGIALIAQSPTIRLLESIKLDSNKNGSLQIYCDAPSGNTVYLIGDYGHGYGASQPGFAMAVIHQPDVCK